VRDTEVLMHELTLLLGGVEAFKRHDGQLLEEGLTHNQTDT
jgi:hypothetical protein